jgi:DNA replication protein DnaC
MSDEIATLFAESEKRKARGPDPFSSIEAEFSERQLAPVPVQAGPKCPICDDIGYVARRVPVGDPDFGKAIPCKCIEQKLISHRLASCLSNSRVLDAYAGLTFETFWACSGGNLDGKDLAVELASQFAAGDDPIFQGVAMPGLVFAGDFGVGKTGLGALGLFGRAARGQQALCIDWRDFLGDVQSTYSRDRGDMKRMPNRRDLVQLMRDVEVLMIDELGSLTAPSSPDRIEITSELIRGRHACRKPTIITTNLNPAGIKSQFGDYVAHRIFEFCHYVEIGGANLRFG